MPQEGNINPIGVVLTANGEVFLKSAQGLREVESGTPVYRGEELITGVDGSAEVRFSDDTLLSQGAESSINLDDYIYDETDGGTSDLLFKMGRGTFRMVTGKIAAQNPEHFKLGSPLATIGIRGTTTVHEIGPDGEKHGVEELHSGRALIIQSLDGGISLITSSLAIVDISSSGIVTDVRPMTVSEFDFFRSIAPEAIHMEDEFQENQDRQQDVPETESDTPETDPSPEDSTPNEDAGLIEIMTDGDPVSVTIADAVVAADGTEIVVTSAGGEVERYALGASISKTVFQESQNIALDFGELSSLLGVSEDTSGTADDLLENLGTTTDEVIAATGTSTAETDSSQPTNAAPSTDTDADDSDEILELLENTTTDTDPTTENDAPAEQPPAEEPQNDTPEIVWTMGTDGPDNLVGDSKTNYINAAGGNDIIDGKQGDDTLLGGAGDDTIDGCNGVDSIDGGDGDDTIYGGQNVDYINGGNGNDLIFGGQNGDSMDGGEGNDTVSYAGGSAVVVNLAQGTVSGGSNTDTLANIENVIGTDNNDILIGDSAANSLTGGAGDDTITGAGGADYLSGGTGSDTFVYNATTDSGDTITGFVHADDGFYFNSEGFTTPFSFVAVTPGVGTDYDGSTGPGTASAFFVYDSDNNQLWYDPDGSGTNAEISLIATVQGDDVVADDITVGAV